jgi:hypothetical protein
MGLLRAGRGFFVDPQLKDAEISNLAGTNQWPGLDHGTSQGKASDQEKNSNLQTLNAHQTI